MKIAKAVITAAGKTSGPFPCRPWWTATASSKTVLRILVEEVLRAGIEEICVVVCPGDQDGLRARRGGHGRRGCASSSRPQPRGYGHAVPVRARVRRDASRSCTWSATTSTSAAGRSAARSNWSRSAEAEDCAVSAVQATRESKLPYYGAVGGRRVAGDAATSTRSRP